MARKKSKKVASKRKRAKRQNAIDRAIAEADALVKLIADGPLVAGIALAAPAFITGPKRKATWRVWTDTIALLADRKMLDALDKYVLAMFCVYVVEFVQANEQIQRDGFTTRVKTISGDHMLRENPAVSIRDTAAKIVLDISRREGFTQLDRAVLVRTQRSADIDPADLFTPPAPSTDASLDESGEDADPNSTAWSHLLDGEQPPSKPN
jgi:P27 family predicted phage terminase small subunit